MFKPLTEENVKDFKNFNYGEFKCKCGKHCNGFPVPFSYDLAKHLQRIRDHFNKPLVITSAVRCEKHNADVGGVRGSKHTKGCAVDFYINGVSYYDLDMFVRSLPYYNYSYRINKNQDVIHYDITPPEIDDKKGYSGAFPTLPKRGYFKKGDKGKEVGKLQEFLNWSLSTELKTKLKIDNDFGKKTKDAVILFQKTYGLTTDGLFGKACLNKAKTIKK